MLLNLFNSLRNRDQMLSKPRINLLSSTHLIKSIKHPLFKVEENVDDSHKNEVFYGEQEKPPLCMLGWDRENVPWDNCLSLLCKPRDAK